MSSNDETLKTGLIIGSTRVARIGPQVAQFILDVLKNTSDADLQSHTDIQVVDIKDFNLPMFDEPGLMTGSPRQSNTNTSTPAHGAGTSRGSTPLYSYRRKEIGAFLLN